MRRNEGGKLMNRYAGSYPVIAGAVLIVALLACGRSISKSEPKAAVAPINISGDLTKIDLCQAVPVADFEAAMGRKLVGKPKPFEYYDTTGTAGCWFDGGKDSSGEAYYGYVVLTPISVYNEQPLHKNVAVDSIGDEAYFNNGADTRQLWVKIDNKVAFVVALGDRDDEATARAIARLVVAAIK
jgi:hypothetical protein